MSKDYWRQLQAQRPDFAAEFEKKLEVLNLQLLENRKETQKKYIEALNHIKLAIRDTVPTKRARTVQTMFSREYWRQLKNISLHVSEQFQPAYEQLRAKVLIIRKELTKNYYEDLRNLRREIRNLKFQQKVLPKKIQKKQEVENYS
jgi:hypothetical protein